jgi:hypothetical protein
MNRKSQVTCIIKPPDRHMGGLIGVIGSAMATS